MFKHSKKGFTLIELLVVIAIIGILSSVVLASLNSARKKSRDARRVSDIKQIQLALELYYDANNRYPAAISAATLGSYISVIPTDPSGTSAAPVAYGFGVDTNGTTYALRAAMENQNTAAVQSDIDGTVLTLACGTQGATEVEYCVQP
jgi:prepilin-type N-terminal cleavage/methylation domain-containing protein